MGPLASLQHLSLVLVKLKLDMVVVFESMLASYYFVFQNWLGRLYIYRERERDLALHSVSIARDACYQIFHQINTSIMIN
jgi:hypothetical protein